MSYSAFCHIRPFVIFDLLSYSTFCDSTFCHIRPFVIRPSVIRPYVIRPFVRVSLLRRRIQEKARLAKEAIRKERQRLYRLNTLDIRAEYAHISDEVFRKGRLQVLVMLLEGSGVFRTEPGRQWWEAAARDNLRAELATLE